MNITRVEYFLAVAKSGTVTAAAAQLRVAQPAVSRHLQQLEHELGVSLFERTGHRLRLTAAGQAFAALAEDFLSRAQHFEDAARNLSHGTVRELTLAAPETSITEIVAPFLATLRPGDPLIRVRRDAPRQMHAALRQGADLVISTEPALASLACYRIAEVPLRAYVAAGHDWARTGRQAVTPAELVTEDLLLLPADYMTRKILDQAVTGAGLAYRRVEECSVSRVIQAWAAAGFGVGVVTELPQFDAHCVLVSESAHSSTPLCLHLHAAWDPEHYAAPVIESLVTRMAAHLGRQPADTEGLV